MKAELVAMNDAQKMYQTQLSLLKATMEGEIFARSDTVDAQVIKKFILADHQWQVERVASLEQLASLRRELLDLEKELAAYGDCDPATFEQTKRAGLLAKEAAVRWTGGCTAKNATEVADGARQITMQHLQGISRDRRASVRRM